MVNKENRRGFIQKLTAMSAGLTLMVKSGFASNSSEKKDEKKVRRIEPLGFQWQTMDPFLFCVHHEDFYPKGNEDMGPNASLEGREIGQDFLIKDGWRMYHGSKVPGFPGHPHRGFETITVVRKGLVDHSDSMGASGRYGNGDVQWMTAGQGVQHAEMFPLIHQNKDNPLELFQIWLNLPKANKFVKPHFKMLWKSTIPTYKYKDEKGRLTTAEVIVGSIGEHMAPQPPPDSWAAIKEHEVGIWNIEMEPGAKWIIPTAHSKVNRVVYFFKGDQLRVDDRHVPNYHAAEVRADISVEVENGSERGYLLILQGIPIGEPVVQHGPMVMNTKEEIRQAFDDYQKTKFGGWPWSVNDPVHPREKGRFAQHADGRLETRG